MWANLSFGDSTKEATLGPRHCAYVCECLQGNPHVTVLNLSNNPVPQERLQSAETRIPKSESRVGWVALFKSAIVELDVTSGQPLTESKVSPARDWGRRRQSAGRAARVGGGAAPDEAGGAGLRRDGRGHGRAAHGRVRDEEARHPRGPEGFLKSVRATCGRN